MSPARAQQVPAPPRAPRRWLPTVIFALLVFGLPLAVRAPYYRSIMVFIGINALAATGLNLLMGYAGQVSLGQAAFVGIGGYTSAVLTANHAANPWLAMLAGVALTCVVAWVIGRPTLRLHGHYLAIATLGFGMIVNIVFVEWRSLTGGTSGIPAVPGLSIGGLALDTHGRFYYLAWAFVLLATIAVRNLQHSRPGRALRAISGSELAAQTAGIDTAKYKLQVFVIGAGLASLAGSLYVHYINFANPDPFDFGYSVELLVIVVLGGLGNVWGPAVGAAIVTVLGEALGPLAKLVGSTSDFDVPAYGLVLILALVFLPRGVAPGVGELGQRLRARFGRRRAPGAIAHEAEAS